MKFAEITRVIEPKLVSVSDEEAANVLPDIVDALFLRIMGNQRVTMRTYGMDESRAVEFTTRIFSNCQNDMSNYLRVPTQEKLCQIIQAGF